MRIFGRHHPSTHLTLRILNGNFALGSFNQNNYINQPQNHNQQHSHNAQRHRTDAAQLKSLRQSPRNIGNNTNRNNQRRTVADPAGSNLITEPDNKHRSADQRNDCRKLKDKSRINDGRHARTAGHPFQTDGNTVSLNNRNQHRQHLGIMGNLAVSGLAVLFKSGQRRNHRLSQLQNNGCRNIGHNVQGKNGHTL